MLASGQRMRLLWMLLCRATCAVVCLCAAVIHHTPPSLFPTSLNQVQLAEKDHYSGGHPGWQDLPDEGMVPPGVYHTVFCTTDRPRAFVSAGCVAFGRLGGWAVGRLGLGGERIDCKRVCSCVKRGWGGTAGGLIAAARLLDTRMLLANPLLDL